jgi:hypothetical protein
MAQADAKERINQIGKSTPCGEAGRSGPNTSCL